MNFESHAVKVLTSKPVDAWNFNVWPVQMKATEQYFPVVLFIMLCKVAYYFSVCGWKSKSVTI